MAIALAHATVYNNIFYVVNTTGQDSVRSEDTTAGGSHALSVMTPWIKLSGLQGFGRIEEIAVLGEYRGSHTLDLQLYRNYSETLIQQVTWTVSPTTVGDGEQLVIRPQIQKMEAIRIRVRERTSTTEAVRLSGLSITYSTKDRAFRVPAAQKS